MNTITIRNAEREEWPTILAIHYRAIHEIASSEYSEDILNAWHSPDIEPDLNDFDKKLNCRQVIIVAEIKGIVVGFGELIPDKNELLAVYVNPDYSRQGVGSEILNELEHIARDKKLTHLQMDASLTAVSFYQSHGYEDIEKHFHELESGIRMDCVKMRKNLT